MVIVLILTKNTTNGCDLGLVLKIEEDLSRDD